MHDGGALPAPPSVVDEDTMVLALALARAMQGARATSVFAVETFLRAIEESDVIGASLEMTYRKKDGRVECAIRVGPEL